MDRHALVAPVPAPDLAVAVVPIRAAITSAKFSISCGYAYHRSANVVDLLQGYYDETGLPPCVKWISAGQ